MSGVRCKDQCGRAVVDEEAALQAGWSYLPITGAWRCGPCAGALYAASTITGTGEPTRDELPPDSRGALPRETASTIVGPAVRA